MDNPVNWYEVLKIMVEIIIPVMLALGILGALAYIAYVVTVFVKDAAANPANHSDHRREDD